VNTTTQFAGLLTPKQVAATLGYDVCNPTERVGFWRAVRAWKIPFYRLGPRTIRFRQDDLNAWLEAKRVGRPGGRAA